MLTALSAAFLFSGAVTAQEKPPPRPDDVVVTGRLSAPDTKAATRRAVQAVSVTTNGQVARFTDPICVSVLGLPQQYAAQLAGLLVSHARDAGLAVAGPGCRANLQVMIVPDGGDVLRGLYKVHPDRFAAIGPDARRRLLAEMGPARVVTGTALLSRDGDRPGATQNTQVASFNDIPMLQVRSASFLDPPTRQDITGVVVLLDRDAVAGNTLGQLAGYAAMRALARTRGASGTTGAVDGGSILALFDEGATPPPGLTRFDAAYLKALYKGPATRSGQGKLGDIAGAISRE